MGSTGHKTSSWEEYAKSTMRRYLISSTVRVSNKPRPFSRFSANRLERLSTLTRDLQYGRVPLHRLDGLRQARRRPHRKDKVSRTNLRPGSRNREGWHPRRP